VRGLLSGDLLPLLLSLLLAAQAGRPELPAAKALDTLDLSDHTVVLSVDDGFHCIYENVYPLLKRYGMTITLGLIVNSVGTGAPSYLPADRFMNVAEIKEMMDSCGIEVASHTLSHARLTEIGSAEAWQEIAGSKRAIESLFGTEIVTFVYPYGDNDARARNMVRRAGYKMARAVRPGTPNFWAEPYRIPEIELRVERKLPDIVSHINRHKITVILLHKVALRPKVFTEWPAADFASLLDWLHHRRVRVVTLRELHRDWWERQLLRALLESAANSDRARDALFQDVDVDATRTPHPR
jgi:peptidoglycan/xylan/chitin deacetylase (PgdA/CDA1 family)